MMLKAYLRSLAGRPAKEAFATRCGTSFKYLRLVAYGAKKCSVELAIAIERESAAQVRAEELRPDVSWEVIRAKAVA